jgi:hypothetical protein
MTSLTPPGLAGQMLTLVYEEAFLPEIGNEVTEYLGGGRTVVHGPWGIDECRAVLLRWFDAGWLDCVAVEQTHTVRKPEEVQHHRYDAEWQARATLVGSHWVLGRADARALIDDPALWSVDGPGAGVCLSRTDATDGLVYADWTAAVSDICGDSGDV